jgi:hypothetical protein
MKLIDAKTVHQKISWDYPSNIRYLGGTLLENLKSKREPSSSCSVLSCNISNNYVVYRPTFPPED